MKFFEVKVGNTLMYGHINGGNYNVSMWNFPADDYTVIAGHRENAQAAWRYLCEVARLNNRLNELEAQHEEEEAWEWADIDLGDE